MIMCNNERYAADNRIERERVMEERRMDCRKFHSYCFMKTNRV